MAERELEAKYVISIDQAALDRAKRGTQELEQAIRRAEQQAIRLQESGEKLTRLGMQTAALGAVIIAPLFLAARNYVQQVGMAEQTSRRWLLAQERMEQSQLRMGRVMAESVTPYIEKIADLTERVASLLESHPEIAQAAMASGALIAGLGTAMMTLGMIQRTVGTLQLLGLMSPLPVVSAEGAAVAGGAAGATSVFMVGASAAAGATIGIEISKALGYKGTFAQGAFDVVSFPARAGLAGQALTALGVKKFGELIGSEALIQAGERAGVGLSVVSKGLDDMRAGLDQAKAPVDNLTSALSSFGANATQAVMAFAQFQKQLEQTERSHNRQLATVREQFRQQDIQAEKRYNAQRGQIAASFARTVNAAQRDLEKRLADLEKQFTRRQTELIANLAKAEARDEDRYYTDRLKRAREHHIDLARMEEDYQRKQRRLREDHDDRLNDLIRTRDARAILTEMRDYEKQRQRNEEDYRINVSRRDADYARQLADQEEAFAEQRAARQEALQEQLADLRENLAEQQAEARAAYEERIEAAQQDRAERLAELEKSYQQEKIERANQQADRLAQLKDAYREQRQFIETSFDESLMFMQTTSEKFLNWFKTKKEELENYLKGSGVSAGGAIGYASGGYAGPGLAMLGERGREFVLNADTTRKLERDLGMLTQEKLLTFGGHTEHTIRFEGVPAGINQAGLEDAVYRAMGAVFTGAARRIAR